jgi:ATP-dependent Clp protease ATP-binding subunit ClpC
MNREILPKVKLIINQASKEAKSFDDIKIKPEHIVLSMISHDDNECIKILKSLKVDMGDLHDKISDYLRKNDLTPRISQYGRNKLPLSDETKIIFKNVDSECEKLNDDAIDTHHLMLSILKIKTPITKILFDAGVNYRSFKKIIMDNRNDMPKENNVKMENDSMDDDFQEPERFKKVKKKTDSKTPILDNFCRDISKAVEKGAIDPVVGRIKEIKRISQILSRRKKNNPVLIGEPGVGKTAIVEGLAQLIKDGNAPRTIANKKVYSLDLASIVAGTKYRGQFEERMKAVLEECKANTDIILFIDELHTIIGAGNASGSLDASNIFKPALARGEIQIIGATTLDEYREHIEKDGALTRRFQQVLVEEPSLEETKIILTNIKEKYEKHHKVVYTDEAIDECVKLSHRYIMERSMPDKAIDVLDEAGAATNITVEKPQIIKTLEQKKIALNNKKKDVVLQQNYEEAAKIRDEEKKIDNQLLKHNKEWADSLDKKITTVGVEQISEVVSMMTGIPLTKISTQESKRLLNLDKELMGKVIGQDDAVSKVVKAIKRNRVGIKDKNKPIGSFIFLGPTGVGKCFLSDTKIIIRNKKTKSIEEIDINELKDRFDEIQKRIKKTNNVLLFDKHELESLKKITKTTKISDYEVLTDDGFVDIEALHETIPYEVYLLRLSDGKELKCADNHIVFLNDYQEIFVKDLQIGDNVIVESNETTGLASVLEVKNLGYEEAMYDLELAEDSNRRYYTNGILSHNTYLAKLLAEFVFGDVDALVKIDMSEYMEKHSVSRLIGSPPGYVGYDQGGQLTEKVRRKPHCVILFDEIEKAHEDVFNLLLQLLDEGQLTDGLGRKVNFKNSLIILTSNLGVKEINTFGTSIGFETTATVASEEARARGIIEKTLKKKFRPEFLNRIDESIIFNELKEDDIHKIIYKELEKLENRLNEVHFKLKINKAAVEFLAKEGYSKEYGARPLGRAIQKYIEDPVADEILSGSITEGEVIKINFDKNKNEVIIKPDRNNKSED